MAAVNKDTPSQAPPSSSPEDDMLKRSTDCVYFLASTCIKGSECEYRHSDLARNNPTDCYYWLSGKCTLNVSCAFRHPPLDVVGMPQAGIYAGPSHPSAKQATPCYYFQSGNCSKGGQCGYLHGPIPTPYSKSKPVPSTTTSTEAPTLKKTIGVSEKGPQMKTNIYSRASNITKTQRQPQVNAAPKVVKAPVVAAPKVVKAPVVAAPPVTNGSLSNRVARSYCASSIDDQNHQNGRDVDDQNGRDIDDSLRESSPGFDVLVDDKLTEDEEYYHNEEQYVRLRDHDGRRSSELDMGGRDDYNSVIGANCDIYRSKYGYEAYDDVRDEYTREPHGAPSERLSVHGRRGPSDIESPDFIQNSSDLRHRLSKQRSGNDLRSVISPDYKSSYYPEDRGFRSSQRDTRSSMRDTVYHPEHRGYRSSRRDSRSPLRETVYHSEDRGYQSSRRDTRSPTRGSSIGGRLQGRIKLPSRSSPLSGRDNENERYLGRLSPSRPRQSSLQGRLRDRLGRRIQEESNEVPGFRGGISRGSTSLANGVLFAGPRRLSEITAQIPVSDGKLKGMVFASSDGTEGDTSFDGPKPLSEILKRKRNASIRASSDENCDNIKEGKKQDENDVNLTSSPNNFDALISAPEQTQGDVQENNDALKAKRYEEEGQISSKKVKLIEDESSFPNDEKHTEVVEGLLGDDGEQPEVDEEFDQGDGEYEYEDDDVEGYNLNEGEVDVGDNEGIMDEDDGDDFAKKLGISV